MQYVYSLFVVIAGIDSNVVYPNGISCTLPEHLQEDLVHTIPGLEQAKLLYPGDYTMYKHNIHTYVRICIDVSRIVCHMPIFRCRVWS